MSGLADASQSRRLGNRLRTLLMLKVAIWSVLTFARGRGLDLDDGEHTLIGRSRHISLSPSIAVSPRKTVRVNPKSSITVPKGPRTWRSSGDDDRDSA